MEILTSATTIRGRRTYKYLITCACSCSRLRCLNFVYIIRYCGPHDTHAKHKNRTSPTNIDPTLCRSILSHRRRTCLRRSDNSGPKHVQKAMSKNDIIPLSADLRLLMTFTTSTSPSPTRAANHAAQTMDLSGGWQASSNAPNIVININDAGSTGRGILIGVLSAFGSAFVAVLVLGIFFFFKYTNRGRIILDRIGRPGEYDDEQAFAKEEAEALQTMDELTRAEYLRAKGMTQWMCELRSILTCRSLCSGKPTRNHPDRYFSFSVSSNSREGRFSLGI